MKTYISIPQCVKKLASFDISVTRGTLYDRIKRNSIPYKIIHDKKRVNFEEILEIYSDEPLPVAKPPTIKQQLEQKVADNPIGIEGKILSSDEVLMRISAVASDIELSKSLQLKALEMLSKFYGHHKGNGEEKRENNDFNILVLPNVSPL